MVILKTTMTKRALLVVDVQQDFLPGGAVPTEDRDIVANVTKLLHSNSFDLTIASQDWHPEVSGRKFAHALVQTTFKYQPDNKNARLCVARDTSVLQQHMENSLGRKSSLTTLCMICMQHTVCSTAKERKSPNS